MNFNCERMNINPGCESLFVCQRLRKIPYYHPFWNVNQNNQGGVEIRQTDTKKWYKSGFNAQI